MRGHRRSAPGAGDFDACEHVFVQQAGRCVGMLDVGAHMLEEVFDGVVVEAIVFPERQRRRAMGFGQLRLVGEPGRETL